MAVEGHHPGIAQGDRLFLGAGIGLLADRNQPAALDEQPAITCGIGGATYCGTHQYGKGKAGYDSAFAACMNGRGYTTK